MRLRKGIHCLETFLLEPYQWGYPVSLWLPPPTPWIVPAILHHSSLETERPQSKGLKGEPPTRHTGEANRNTYKVLCPLGLTRKLRLGLGQQLNSSLDVDLVVDMLSHLSKIGGDCFVLDKSVARKKKKSFLKHWVSDFSSLGSIFSFIK